MNDDVKRLRTPQRPPFDAELAEALTQVRDEMPVTVTSSGIGAIRERAARTTASVEELAAEYGVAVRIVTATRHGGPNLRLLVARPPTPTSGALYWIHGGGGVLGDFRFGIDPALTWAAEFGVTVVSVDYRLAPEHRDPVAVEDCYAGLCWLASNARTLQVDPTRIIVGGHSAGAGLAAGTALLARDRGGPRAHGQLLLCPMLDDREQTVSSRLLAGEGVWDRTANRTAWAARLGAPVAEDRRSVRTRRRPARGTSADCRPRSWTSARSTPSGTRPWSMRHASGPTVARPSCTCGQGPITASRSSRRPRHSRQLR